MSRPLITLPSLLLALGLGLAACGVANDPDPATTTVEAPAAGREGSTARVEVPKMEREGVWQPAPGGRQIPLWPANVPLARPDSGDRPEMTGNGSPTVGGRRWHWATYVTRPTMTVYRPKGRNTGAAMLVLPGGGFHAVAMDLEGTEVCDWVVRQGMTCVVLKYRTPQVWPRVNGRQQRPEVLLGLEDAQRAMTLLRHDAADYGIDPQKIGVIGFSAGANLVGHASWDRTPRTYEQKPGVDDPRGPDFTIFVYGGGFLEKEDKTKFREGFSVPADAPPCFFVVAHNDGANPLEAAKLYIEYKRQNLPAEIHVYSKGGHGFGTRQTKFPVDGWTRNAGEWMASTGWLKPAAK